MKKILAVAVLTLVFFMSTFVGRGQRAVELQIDNTPAEILISFFGDPWTEYRLFGTSNILDWSLDDSVIVHGNGAGMYQYRFQKVEHTNVDMGFFKVQTVGPSALALISLNENSPLTETVVASDVVNGQFLDLPVLRFDVGAQHGTLRLGDVRVNFAAVFSGAQGAIAAAYLYNGSTLIQSASVVGGVATFSKISAAAEAVIPQDVTMHYTVKVDVTGITGKVDITASVPSEQNIFDLHDNSVTVIGFAQGNTQTVLAAPVLLSGLSGTASKASRSR